ncbi:MAG: hypothetical protein IJH05_03450 [Firmicutes bacterium]|nr:hypothetical protein [Bacillota bacterium]
MANNQYVNKVIYGGNTLIDISGDTVSADKVLASYTFHDRSGARVTGTCTYDADTSDASATVAEILATKTAYVNGAKLTGTMTNNGAISGTITTKAQQYTVPQGYHDGSGKVQISTTEQNKIIATNIKAGIQILGVTGTYSGEAVSVQAKTATPATTQQVILPDTGYDYLSQVTVNAISYVETDNSAGGKTVTIAGA